jgi:CheY-like chemotaxis protein
VSLKKQPFDVILLDLVLPDSDGVNTFFRVHNQNPLIPIVVLTELVDEAIGSYSVEKGAKDFLVISSYDGTANCNDTVGHNTFRIAEVIIFLKNE